MHITDKTISYSQALDDLFNSEPTEQNLTLILQLNQLSKQPITDEFVDLVPYILKLYSPENYKLYKKIRDAE